MSNPERLAQLPDDILDVLVLHLGLHHLSILRAVNKQTKTVCALLAGKLHARARAESLEVISFLNLPTERCRVHPLNLADVEFAQWAAHIASVFKTRAIAKRREIVGLIREEMGHVRITERKEQYKRSCYSLAQLLFVHPAESFSELQLHAHDEVQHGETRLQQALESVSHYRFVQRIAQLDHGFGQGRDDRNSYHDYVRVGGFPGGTMQHVSLHSVSSTLDETAALFCLDKASRVFGAGSSRSRWIQPVLQARADLLALDAVVLHTQDDMLQSTLRRCFGTERTALLHSNLTTIFTWECGSPGEAICKATYTLAEKWLRHIEQLPTASEIVCRKLKAVLPKGHGATLSYMGSDYLLLKLGITPQRGGHPTPESAWNWASSAWWN